jgi:hypothetical protein
MIAVALFVFTSLPTWVAVALASKSHEQAVSSGFLRWDAKRYLKIANEGYSYHAGTQSDVAFFPAYPYSARLLAYVTRSSEATALVVLANICLAATFVLLAKYVRQVHAIQQRPRETDSRAPIHEKLNGLAVFSLLAFGLFPTSFFFRMGYSESMFLCIAIGCLYGLARQWPLPFVAFLAGLATGTRSIGIVLSAVVCTTAWLQQSEPRWKRVVRLLWLVPLCCWGLAEFMLYQYFAFGDSFAFAKTQEYWRIRQPTGIVRQLILLLAWEPVWSVYDPTSVGYWRDADGNTSWITNLQFWNPILFGMSLVFLAVGTLKRWLNSQETVVGLGFILIPYFTRGYEMCMNSQGRFVAVAFPMYIVIARLLLNLPPWGVSAVFVAGACVTGLFAHRFAIGHLFY